MHELVIIVLLLFMSNKNKNPDSSVHVYAPLICFLVLFLPPGLLVIFSSSSSDACPESESEASAAFNSSIKSSIAKGAWSIMVLKMLLQMALKRVRLDIKRRRQNESGRTDASNKLLQGDRVGFICNMKIYITGMWWQLTRSCRDFHRKTLSLTNMDLLFGSGCCFAEWLNERQVLIGSELRREEKHMDHQSVGAFPHNEQLEESLISS